jgi:hypothetical protein
MMRWSQEQERVLLQHPADRSEWLSDSRPPAMPLDHAGINP